ncbi:RNA helicase [Bifidobacterium animalis subsp. animalis MCC 0499]|uniref:DEAD/DEAH box helicase n=1 Tax=Bifidobacterium animalis TaxID=28025 RepID=UPI00069A0DAC|nr:DEAD/DEAH box helicase [Bifidobacterium animalis]KOA58479.1 RNA helicase [Bifidobacterium animalis subsp. animalis MCC 0499]
MNDADSIYEEPARSFGELGVPGPLVRLLAADGKKTAFPIQQDTLPDSLAGRDVLGRGQTGSGKTLAFGLPLVSRLSDMDRADDHDFPRDMDPQALRKSLRFKRGVSKYMPHPRGLVLAPTRELANQISDVLTPLADAYGMAVTTVYGGVKYERQFRDLDDGADIVVACPGRLEDLIEQQALTLADVRIVVLDEADEMADMGFLPPIKRILKQIRPDAQHMLFSATLDHGVDEVVSEFLHDPKVHSVDEVTSNVDSMTHHLFLVSRNDKAAVVRELASGRGRRILFTRTKFQAKKLAHTLTQSGIPAAELHGNLSQHQRDRNLQAFESGQVNVLVATDVAARGIDVSNVGLVVQVEPPEDPKSFTHRSGRTARAGQSGDVVTLMTPDQKRKIRHLFKEVDIKLKPVEVTPESPQVQELVGQKADPVHGWELPELERKPRKSNGGRKSRRDRGRTNRDEERGSRSARGGRRTGKGEHRPTERERQIAKEQQEFAALFLGDVSSDNPRYSEPAESEQASRHERDRRRDERPRNRRERRAEQFGEAGDDRDYKKSRQNRNNGKKRIERRHARREEEREERRGGKRIHHHDNDRLFDARDESVKRHERRLEAREQTRTAPKRARKSGKHSQFKNKGKRRNDNPFRGGHGRR